MKRPPWYAAVLIFSILTTCQSSVNASNGITYDAGPLLVTSSDPDAYVVTPGGAYGGVPGAFDGVVRIYVQTSSGDIYGGTGALLSTGKHILTAAHVISDDFGMVDVEASGIYFDLPGGEYWTYGQTFTAHPDWDGDAYRGNDLAVIELPTIVPSDIPRYELYEDTDEVGRIGMKVGYGVSGEGGTGIEDPPYSFGTKRWGLNRYDATADMMLNALGTDLVPDFIPGSVLQYDFDNGLAENDAFGFFFGLDDLGLGLSEVSAAFGDSGGPTFIDGKIAGVTSYGISLLFSDGSTSDVDAFFDASFGEFASDTRVSYHADWVNSMIVVPEPTSVVLLGTLLGGLAVAAGLRRRRAR